MIRTLIYWEIWLLVAFALVVGQELVALLYARRKGLTQNVSRVASFSLLLALAAVYALLDFGWLRYDDGADSLEALRRLPTANWGYLVLGIMIAVVLTYEVTALLGARRAGLTKAVTRLASLLAAVFLLIVLMGINQAKWNLYLERLEATYLDAIQAAGD